jgi:hypothetical protein
VLRIWHTSRGSSPGNDAEPCNRPERPTEAPLGSRRATRASARSLQTFGAINRNRGLSRSFRKRETSDMFRRGRLVCSFCGKDEADVAKLVAGPRVYICDECVAVANRIMGGDGPDQPTTHHMRRGLLERLRERIHALLERGKVQRSACRSTAS